MASRFALISALVVALSPSLASASTVFLADCGVGTVPDHPTWSTSREVYVYVDGNSDVKSPNTHAVVPWDNGVYPWRLSGVTVPFSDNTNWAFTINNDIFDFNYAGYGVHRDANGQRIESLYCYAHHDVDLGPSPSGSGLNCQSTFLCRNEAPPVPCPPNDGASQPTSYPVSPTTPSYGVSRTSVSTSNLGTSSFQPTGWSSSTSSLSSSTFLTSTLSSLGTTSRGSVSTSVPLSSFWSTSSPLSTQSQSFSFTVNTTTGFPTGTSGFGTGTGTGTGTATGTVPTGTSDPNPTDPASRTLSVKVEAHPRQVRVQRLWTAIVQKALVDIWGNCHSESIYLSDDTSIRYRCSGSNIEGYGRKTIVPVLIDALYRMGQEKTWIVESDGYTTLPMAMSVLVSDGSSEAFVKYNLESPNFRYVGDQCVDCSQSESKFTEGWDSAAIEAFAPTRPPISGIFVENTCNPENHCIQPDVEPTGAPPLWWW